MSPTPSLFTPGAATLPTPYMFLRESLDLWALAYGAWFDAAAAWSCAGLDLCRAATSAHLAAAGLEQPLLSDP